MKAISAAVIAASMFSQPAISQTKLGDWLYQTRAPFYAATVNDSGNYFGQWCDLEDRSCMYMVAMPTRCDDEESYPVLINSDTSSLSTTIVCKGKLSDSKLYRYAFGNFEQIDVIARKATRIGIAIPLAGDQFKVIRFSLQGAELSLTVMRAAADRAVPAQDQRNTRDQRL